MIKQNRQLKKRLPVVQLLALEFFLLILVGSGLLTLPFFSNSGHGTNPIDALLTATSAICVTGLTTLSTAEYWNSVDQLLIIPLIEVGGPGFMMVPILCFALIKREVSLSTHIILKGALDLEEVSDVTKLMPYILKLALAVQLIDTVILSFVFVPEFDWLRGTWHSLFHTTSNFCNAGFDLLGDNLTDHQQNVYLIMVVSASITSGGLGFIVWRDLLEYHQKKKMTIHSKIVLAVTGTLLLGGFVVFSFIEHNGATSVGGNMFQRLTNTFFVSVTFRTVGYYSIDYLHMSHTGLILTTLLMYTGGMSGSTVSGLKATMLGALLIQVRSILKGCTRAEAFSRIIHQGAALQTLTLFFIMLTLCVVAIMILSVTETIPKASGIEYITFGVFSAFGTVGLTTGLTPDLTAIGESIIIALMYIGRIGASTVIFSLVTKAQRTQSKYKHPEESAMIGQSMRIT